MTVPFFHSAAGVHVSGSRTYWASFRSVGERIGRVRYASEPVPGRDTGGALGRLAARSSPGDRFVSAHLDPVHVRHEVVDGPAFDEDVALAAWIHAQLPRWLPPGTDASRFVVRHDVVARSEEGVRCLVALAPREAVDARRAVLAAAGLRPLCLASVEVDLRLALAYHPAFADGATAVLWPAEPRTHLLHFRDGILHATTVLPGADDREALLDALSDSLDRAPDGVGSRDGRLLVLGADAAPLVARLRRLRPGAAAFEAHVSLPGGRNGRPLPPTHVAAAALALRQVYPDLAGIDFLEPEDARAALQEREKHDAVRTIFWSGGGVAACALAVVLFGALVGRAGARTEAALRPLAGRIAEVEQERRTLAGLESDVEEAERLVSQRTRAALLLARAGRAAPDALRLDGLALSHERSGAARLVLTGTAGSERDVAVYLDRLERLAAVRDVQLVFAAVTPARTGDPESAPGEAPADAPAVRFEVILRTRPTPDGSPPAP